SGFYVQRINVLKHEKDVQQEFSRQLIANVESERKRIAGEIHDSLGQNLLVVKNILETGAEPLPRENQTKKALTRALEMIGQTVQEARTLSHTLHPLILEELGLTKALQLLVRKSAESFGFECIPVIEDVDGAFSAEAEVHLFRIVQECLNNIVKHAHATKVTIYVRRLSRTLEIVIEDNGAGFDVGKQESTSEKIGGFGRKNMKERARLLHADITVTSSPGKGTVVRVRCPIPEIDHTSITI
ncbi:MAG TPA: sensor histidine kinase, partial [Bacteroidota bacterium]|nr:sensor histidine kinase [Bacteroidota bacterium]